MSVPEAGNDLRARPEVVAVADYVEGLNPGCLWSDTPMTMEAPANRFGMAVTGRPEGG
jgi:hypothetical protein